VAGDETLGAVVDFGLDTVTLNATK